LLSFCFGVQWRVGSGVFMVHAVLDHPNNLKFTIN